MLPSVEETVRYNYRLRPSKTVARALIEEGHRCRLVWNQCVQRSRELFEEGLDCGPAALDLELKDWRNTDSRWSRWVGEGSSVTQQQTIIDFGKARSKAIADRKAKLPMAQRRGMPTFHSVRDTRPSMNYTRRGFSITADNRLKVAGGLSIPVVWSRELPSEPTSVRVSIDASGHWYASFVVTREVEQIPEPTGTVGIDWGVKTTAVATTPEFDMDHARHGHQTATKLAKAQRKMSRRRRGTKNCKPSAGYLAAKHETARLYQKAAWQRKDQAHKWARHVVEHNSQIAVEDFKPKFLAKTTMAKKAADGAIGQAKRTLIEHATRHQRDLRLVNPAYTTMDCGGCHARAKHRLPLSQRTYICESCGLISDRDRNSAAVMVARAGFCIDTNVDATGNGDPASADRRRPTPSPV